MAQQVIMGFAPPPNHGDPLYVFGHAEPLGWMTKNGRYTPNPKHPAPRELTIDEKFDRWLVAETDKTFGEWAYPAQYLEKPVLPPNHSIKEGVLYNPDGSVKRGWFRRWLAGTPTVSIGPR